MEHDDAGCKHTGCECFYKPTDDGWKRAAGTLKEFRYDPTPARYMVDRNYAMARALSRIVIGIAVTGGLYAAYGIWYVIDSKAFYDHIVLVGLRSIAIPLWLPPLVSFVLVAKGLDYLRWEKEYQKNK